MYAQLHNTIRAQRNRPLLACRDISGNQMDRFYDQLLDYFSKHANQQMSIGDTAVQFYLQNHGVALIDGAFKPDEMLPENISALYNQYHDVVGKIGVKMVYDIVFMLTAMTSTTHPDAYHLDEVEQTYGKSSRELIEGLIGQTSGVSYWTPNYSQLKPVLMNARKHAEKVELGKGIRAMGYILDVRQRELSYGPLWRDIARMASEFFNGHKSLETTIDTAFTFCHCNGSFFEKGKLFSPVGNALFDALDVQRSGQIPQFVNEGSNPLTRHATTRKIHHEFAQVFPEVFKSKLDKSIVKQVTRNQLVFTQKYAHHWNNQGIAQQQAHEAPKPKIFSPIDEDGYLNLTKGL